MLKGILMIKKILSILDEAIAQHKILSFSYETMNRTVEPYHYGILKGKQQLHAFQIAGESHGKIPQWRNFMLYKIKDIKLHPSSFNLRADYNPYNARYTFIEKSVYFTVSYAYHP